MTTVHLVYRANLSEPLSILVFACRIWDLILLVPDECLPFYTTFFWNCFWHSLKSKPVFGRYENYVYELFL